jgi:hypothetical protein
LILLQIAGSEGLPPGNVVRVLYRICAAWR